MGSGDKGKGFTESIAEEAKAVAVEVYKDAAKPAVAAAGGTLGRLVRLALRPIELLAQGGERLMSAVERKLSGVPEDRLLPAPTTIAAPAALHYALLGDGNERRSSARCSRTCSCRPWTATRQPARIRRSSL